MLSSFWRYARQHHIALIALFMAIGGTSYAAVALPRNSVGSSQVRNNSLTGDDIKNGSLRAGDIGARLSDGPGHLTYVQGPKDVASSGVASSRAECPTGTVLVGGGGATGTFDSPVSSRPYGEFFYSVISVNNYSGSTPEYYNAEAQAFAICAADKGAGTTDHTKVRVARRAYRTDVARVRARAKR